MDLFGPSSTLSLGGKTYCFVIDDDYSRFTWVFFLSHKSEAFHHIEKESKTKKAAPLLLLEVMEVENSHMNHLNPIVRSMVFCIIFCSKDTSTEWSN